MGHQQDGKPGNFKNATIYVFEEVEKALDKDVKITSKSLPNFVLAQEHEISLMRDTAKTITDIVSELSQTNTIVNVVNVAAGMKKEEMRAYEPWGQFLQYDFYVPEGKETFSNPQLGEHTPVFEDTAEVENIPHNLVE
jgi:hypothetical protein